MKFASFKTDSNDRTQVGLIVNGSLVNITRELGIASMIELIENIDAFRTQLSDVKNNPLAIDSVKWMPPIERPGKIICLAGNYRAHIAESGFVTPQVQDVITQQLFLKPSSTLVGNDGEILVGKNNVKVGWETELAVVIGKRGRDIPAGSAMDHVFGYTIMNDVSERGVNSKIENRRYREMDKFLDWLAGKWFDTFAPCGPWIVTRDEIPDPHNLEIRLTINGEIKQQGNSSEMIFSIPEQIAYASSIMTLEPGDIISTGTPAGAGIGGTSTSLQDRDQLVCEIERIGTLNNKVRFTA